MNNFAQKGDVVTVVAGGARTSGTPVKEGKLFGVPQADAESGKKYALLVQGVVKLSKDGNAYSLGDYAYWDGSTITNDSANDDKVGIVTKAALAGDSKIEILLIQGHI